MQKIVSYNVIDYWHKLSKVKMMLQLAKKQDMYIWQQNIALHYQESHLDDSLKDWAKILIPFVKKHTKTTKPFSKQEQLLSLIEDTT